MTEGLKACPFCGCDEVEHDELGVTGHECCGFVEWNEWNTRPIEDALRAEVAELKADREQNNIDYCFLRNQADAQLVEIAGLTAELGRWRAPLTEEQKAEAAGIWERIEDDGTDYGNVRDWDAAIRRVRGESK